MALESFDEWEASFLAREAAALGQHAKDMVVAQGALNNSVHPVSISSLAEDRGIYTVPHSQHDVYGATKPWPIAGEAIPAADISRMRDELGRPGPRGHNYRNFGR